MEKQLNNLYSSSLSTSSLKVVTRKSHKNIITQIQDINLSPFRQTGGIFIDPDFPHLKLSIGQNYQQSEDINIQWVSVSELTQNPVYSSQAIHIQQINFNNAFINNALLIIKLFAKEKFEEITQNKEINSEGIFFFQVLHQGIIKKVYLDSFIPTIAKKQLFTRTYKNCIMPPLLQKLFAKIYGSYQNICQPLVDLVELQTLYCKQVILYHQFNQEQLYVLLTEKLRNGSIILFQTRKSDKIQQLGLIKNFQYAISRLIKIKNEIIVEFLEFGGKQWRGKYAKSRSLWKLWQQEVSEHKIVLHEGSKENYICCKDLKGLSRKFYILNNTTTYHKSFRTEPNNSKKFNFYNFCLQQENHIMIRILFKVKCRNTVFVIEEKEIFNQSKVYYLCKSIFCQSENESYIQVKLGPGQFHLIVNSKGQDQGVSYTITYFTSIQPTQLLQQEPEIQILEKSIITLIQNMNYPKLDINLQLQSYAVIKHLYTTTGLGFIFFNINQLHKQKVIIQINKEMLAQNYVSPLNFQGQKYQINANTQRIFLFQCHWKEINKTIEFPPKNSIKIYIKNTSVSQLHSISNLEVNSY